MTTSFSIEETRFGVEQLIERHLLASLREIQEQAINESLTFSHHVEAGELIAGLTGSTSYGWLLIKTLWVHPNHRRKGYGHQLISIAKAKALTHGCLSVWLDTSNQSAFLFYTKLGFEVFGCLENAPDAAPAGHKRWFMNNRISEPV